MPSDRRFVAPFTVKLQNIGEEASAFSTVEQACAHVQTLFGLHWKMVATGRMRLPADLDAAMRIAQGFAKDLQLTSAPGCGRRRSEAVDPEIKSTLAGG